MNCSPVVTGTRCFDGSEPPFVEMYNNRAEGFFDARAESLPFADRLGARWIRVETIEVRGSPIDALLPYPEKLLQASGYPLTLDDYGIWRAEVFLREVFSVGE